MAYTKSSRRSLKQTKETPLEMKARQKLERLQQDFKTEKSRMIVKKRTNLNQEKKLLR